MGDLWDSVFHSLIWFCDPLHPVPNNLLKGQGSPSIHNSFPFLKQHIAVTFVMRRLSRHRSLSRLLHQRRLPRHHVADSCGLHPG